MAKNIKNASVSVNFTGDSTKCLRPFVEITEIKEDKAKRNLEPCECTCSKFLVSYKNGSLELLSGNCELSLLEENYTIINEESELSISEDSKLALNANWYNVRIVSSVVFKAQAETCGNTTSDEIDLSEITFAIDSACNFLVASPTTYKIWASIKVLYDKKGDLYKACVLDTQDKGIIFASVEDEAGEKVTAQQEFNTRCEDCEVLNELKLESFSDKEFCNEGQPFECHCNRYALFALPNWDLSFSSTNCTYNLEKWDITENKKIEEDISKGHIIRVPSYRTDVRNISYDIYDVEKKECADPFFYFDDTCNSIRTRQDLNVTGKVTYYCDEHYARIFACTPLSQIIPGFLRVITNISDTEVLEASTTVEKRCEVCEDKNDVSIEEYKDEEECLDGEVPACHCIRYKIYHSPDNPITITTDNCRVVSEGKKTKRITTTELVTNSSRIDFEDWKQDVTLNSFRVIKVVLENCILEKTLPSINWYYDSNCHALKTTNEISVIAEISYSYTECFTKVIACLDSLSEESGSFTVAMSVQKDFETFYYYATQELSSKCEDEAEVSSNVIESEDGKNLCDCNCKEIKIYHGNSETIELTALKGTVKKGSKKTETIKDQKAEFSKSRKNALDSSYVSVELDDPDFIRTASDDCPQSAQYNSIIASHNGSFVWNNTAKSIEWSGSEAVTATVPYTAVRTYTPVTACSRSGNGAFVVKNGPNTEVITFEPECSDNNIVLEIEQADEELYKTCNCNCTLYIVYSSDPSPKIRGINCSYNFVKDVVISGTKTEVLNGESSLTFDKTYYDLRIKQKDVVTLRSITNESEEEEEPVQDCEETDQTLIISSVPVVGVVVVDYKRRGKLYSVCLTNEEREGVFLASKDKTVATVQVTSNCEKSEEPEKELELENLTDCDCQTKIVVLYQKNCPSPVLVGHNLDFVEVGNYTKKEDKKSASFNGENSVSIGYFDTVTFTEVYSSGIDALSLDSASEMICNQGSYTNPDIGKFFYDAEKGVIKLTDNYVFWGIVEYSTTRSGTAYKVRAEVSTEEESVNEKKGVLLASYNDIYTSLDIDFSCEEEKKQISIESDSGPTTDCKCKYIAIYSDKEYAIDIFNGTYQFYQRKTKEDISYSIMTSDDLSNHSNPAGGTCTYSIIDTISVPVTPDPEAEPNLCLSRGPENLYTLHIVQTKCVKQGDVYQVCSEQGLGGSLRFPGSVSGDARGGPAMLVAYFVTDSGEIVSANTQIESSCGEGDNDFENVQRSISIDTGGRGYCLDDEYIQNFLIDSDVTNCLVRSTAGTVSCSFAGYRKRKKVVIVAGNGCAQIAPPDATDVEALTVVDYVGGSEPLIERASDNSWQLCPRVVGTTDNGDPIRGNVYGVSEIRYNEPYTNCELRVKLGHSDAQLKGKLILDCVRQFKGFNVADFTAKCEKETSEQSDVEVPLHMKGTFTIQPKGQNAARLGAVISVYPNFAVIKDPTAKLSITTKEGKNLVLDIPVKITPRSTEAGFKVKEVLVLNNNSNVTLKAIPEITSQITANWINSPKDKDNKDVNVSIVSPGNHYTQFGGFSSLATFTDEGEGSGNDTKIADIDGSTKRVRPNELVIATGLDFFKGRSFNGIDNVNFFNPKNLDLNTIAVPIYGTLEVEYTTMLGKYDLMFELEHKNLKGKDLIFQEGSTVSFYAQYVLKRYDYTMTVKGDLSLGSTINIDPAKDVTKLATADALGTQS